MTFRAKPAVKRSHRPAWETQDRRNLFINLGFVGVIVVGLLILAGAAGASYYGDHFTTVATVNGQTVNKDDLAARVAVDSWRLTHVQSVIQQSVSSGKLTQAQANSQLQQLQTQAQQLPKSSLDALVDDILQAQLAAKQGVSVTDQQVDQKLVQEATTPEFRHAWLISVAPDSSAGTTPTDAAKASAKAKADKALADIKAGQKWEDVAKAVSGDPSAASGGDLSWVQQQGGLDQGFLDALFKLPVNGVTDVLLGADGTYRIGRVTQIDPSKVDPNYQQSITGAGVSMDAYRKAVRGEVLKQALSDKITNDALNQPSLMRQVSEIYLAGTPGAAPVDEVKAAHILFSPNGDPQKASTLPATDPAWAKAEASANTAYQELLKNPSSFAALAKKDSNDTVSGADGGTLPWFKQADVDASFGTAVFAPGLKVGQILPPVKSQFGWHIIRFDGRRADASVRIKQLHDQAVGGADFATLAKANDEGPQASTGGDLGWVAANQIDPTQEAAIFKAPIGSISDILTTDSGYYIFKVWKEETRKPEGDQAATLKSSAFTNWYAAQKKAAAIVEDQTLTRATG